ncbi:MAG: TetR/AcrR family transcriptional regulator [Azospirillum brasilense]|nr:MAG: TetR/AcrR family transcriptional regulator [Azospirillum brasilense]
MARPKSNNKRQAILDAAVRVIVVQGLSAPTAAIAKEAGIANGSLFTYFKTKAELYNQLYIDLKTQIATAALKGFPAKAELRTQLYHAWTNWMAYAVAHPEHRHAMKQLSVSEEITPETRAIVFKNMAELIHLMEQVRLNGPMKNDPQTITGSLITGIFEATMDTMIQDPANAKKHSKTAFNALWRMMG